jgi:hypothetical protein
MSVATSEVHTPAPRISPRSTADRRRIGVTLLGVSGGVAAAMGAASPWLSFFGGLMPLPGTAGLSGQLALGLGLASILAAFAYGTTGARAARWALASLGVALLAVAGTAAINLLGSLPALQADPLRAARPEPGIVALVAGAVLVFATFFIEAPVATDGPGRLLGAVRARARNGLVVALAFAGVVHLAVSAEHMAESVLIGSAMLLAGVAQIVLAALIARGATGRLVTLGVPVLSIALVAAWVAAVTIGLPVEAHPHAAAAVAGHGATGHVEPVSVLGVTTAVAELAAIALASLLAPAQRRRVEAAATTD